MRWPRTALRTALAAARAALLALALVLPSAAPVRAQDALDQGALDRCTSTLGDLMGLTPDAPEYLDTLTLCYTVETSPPPDAGQPTYEPNDVVTSYFGPGSVVKVTRSDVDEITAYRGATSPDIKGDLEALNRARGGSGSYIGPKPPKAAGGSTDPCMSAFGSLDDAIATTQDSIASTEAHLKSLQQELKFWMKLDDAIMTRATLFMIQQTLVGMNMSDLLGPITPLRKAELLDQQYRKPTPYNFANEYMHQEEGPGAPRFATPVTFGDRLAAWQADPDYGVKAAAEKAEYEQTTYPQLMQKFQASHNSTPQSLEDLRLIGEPARRIRDIGALQDLDVLSLKRDQQNLTVWNEAKRAGLNCAFATGPLGSPVAIPAADPSVPYFAYVFKGIGVVIATQNDATTTPSCIWTGGGPRPCPNAPPATILATIGGPYTSMTDAKADLKTKLDCTSGFWGAQAKWNGTGQWLQNNVGTGDCKTLDGKPTP